MKQEFVMRGQTVSGGTEVLNFSGHKPGYVYRMTEFEIYPSNAIASNFAEILGSVTAGKTAVDPPNPNFNDEGLIATAMMGVGTDLGTGSVRLSSIVNDTFLITQDLILMVQDTQGDPVNWQCRFVAEKVSSSEEAVANFRQFTIFDG
jgi:hypothetical protein